MATDERIKIEKLQFDINRDATKTSALYQVVKLVNMNDRQVINQCPQIKVE